MKLKHGLICLLVTAMLTACMPSVTASGSKLTTDQQARAAPLNPTLTMLIENQNGQIIKTTTVNHPVFIGCGLYLGTLPGLSPPIGNAYVDIQITEILTQNVPDGTWTTMFTVTTGSNGVCVVKWTPTTTGVFNVRAYYDGGGQYNSYVSDVSQLTIFGSGQ